MADLVLAYPKPPIEYIYIYCPRYLVHTMEVTIRRARACCIMSTCITWVASLDSVHHTQEPQVARNESTSRCRLAKEKSVLRALSSLFAKMRLLHAKDYSLHSFETEPSPYAILSHTWHQEEVTLTDISNKHFSHLAGFAKIKLCCEQAVADGFEYVVSHMACPRHVKLTTWDKK